MHTALSKTNHPAAVLRDVDGLDMRVVIYHQAFHRQPTYDQATFIHLLASGAVTKRPQLFAINGRPC